MVTQARKGGEWGDAPPKTPEEKIELGFQFLKKFVEREGNARVKRRHKEGETEYSLGTWCSQRRYEYWRGKLSQERIDRLEELGFEWGDAPGDPPTG